MTRHGVRTRAVEDIVVCEVLVEQAVVPLRNGILADAHQTVGERLPIMVSRVDSLSARYGNYVVIPAESGTTV